MYVCLSLGCPRPDICEGGERGVEENPKCVFLCLYIYLRTLLYLEVYKRRRGSQSQQYPECEHVRENLML